MLAATRRHHAAPSSSFPPTKGGQRRQPPTTMREREGGRKGHAPHRIRKRQLEEKGDGDGGDAKTFLLSYPHHHHSSLASLALAPFSSEEPRTSITLVSRARTTAVAMLNNEHKSARFRLPLTNQAEDAFPSTRLRCLILGPPSSLGVTEGRKGERQKKDIDRGTDKKTRPDY